jgi:predicted Zn finger-like uncharacterized protein
MALATTCPLCKTSFKVVPDQLKLSRGSVRCGVCQNVFSGIDHLRYVDQSAIKDPKPWQASTEARAGAGTEADPQPSPSAPLQAAGNQLPMPDGAGAPGGTVSSDDLKTAFFLPETGFGNQVSDALTGAAITPKRDNDFSNLPRMRFSPHVASDQGAPTPSDTVNKAADGQTGSGQRSVIKSGAAESVGPAQPAILQGSNTAHGISESQHTSEMPSSKNREASLPGEVVTSSATLKVAPLSAKSTDFSYPGKSESRKRQPFALMIVAFLVVGLLVQALIGWRNDIAARSPAMSAVLNTVLDPLGLTISPPLDLSAMSIESFELQTGRSANVLQMTAILRNRSSHVVSFPAMELTLTDSSGALLSRKVIRVESFVDTPLIAAQGLAARSELPLRIALEHDGLAPAGYSVALFYP